MHGLFVWRRPFMLAVLMALKKLYENRRIRAYPDVFDLHYDTGSIIQIRAYNKLALVVGITQAAIGCREATSRSSHKRLVRRDQGARSRWNEHELPRPGICESVFMHSVCCR